MFFTWQRVYFAVKVRTGGAAALAGQRLPLALTVTPGQHLVHLVSSCPHALAMKACFPTPALLNLSPWILILLRS